MRRLLGSHEAAERDAQLETEYGIDEIPPPRSPVLAGLSSGISFAVGAGIPVTITVLAPLAIDAIAVLMAVVVSLCLTSIIAARSSYLSASRTIIRSLVVGLGTLSVSYAAGLVLLPPADRTMILRPEAGPTSHAYSRHHPEHDHRRRDRSERRLVRDGGRRR